MLFSPLSERIGRKSVYTCTLVIGIIFIIPEALAPNIGTLLIARTIDGIAFSAPLVLVSPSAELSPDILRFLGGYSARCPQSNIFNSMSVVK